MFHFGKTLVAALTVTIAALPSFAADQMRVTELLSTESTASGQPIVLPQHDVQLIVERYVIPPGVTLPIHKHPAQRYAYVLSGHLTVTLTETGEVLDYKRGAFIVEVRDQWHFGTAVGDEPVVLLVIDQVKRGQKNTVLKSPR